MRPQIRPERIKQIEKMTFMLREEFNVATPYTPVKRMLNFFSKIYYFESNHLNPDFELESGFSVYILHEGGYKTYINAGLPEGKDLFTHGHEFGHIALGHHIAYDIKNLTYYQYEYLDAEADIFSANLLMPAEWVRVYANPPIWPATIFKMKTLFGVSWTAMINRLDELGIQERSESCKQFNKIS